MNTKIKPDESVLVVGGQPLDDVTARIRRYCGLAWNGRAPETWAYRYYDMIDSDPHAIAPVDVLAASSLHPGLSRDDLAWFWDHARELTEWVNGFPTSAALATADDSTVERLGELAELFDGVALSLLTKVVHRKRPHLVPLIDRELIDWFRPATGERRAVSAWQPILRHLRADLAFNAAQLTDTSAALDAVLGRPLSHIRLIDIAIWMGGQR